MFNALRLQLAKLISPQNNAMSLPNQFLRYGNGSRMSPNWSDILINDRDLYTGYAYAAIRNRAVQVARVAAERIRTSSTTDDIDHPYLDKIWNSPTFTEFGFWTHYSTFMDLEGVYYIMVIRASDGTRYGNIKELKLLNPYNIRRVLDGNNLEVEGYVETRKGFVREIPKEMIIEIRELNPFSEDEPFAMTDAAKESQYTLKTSGDYTRNVIRNNINAPGILSTDVILEDKQFENFKARVKSHTKGEPLFGNGSGAITWQSMTTDLSKAALKETNEINRDSLISVAGVSKTILGIEQSGTTRETAKVQKDLHIEGQVIPRIQLMLDALNLDYRNKYPKEYAATEAYLYVDNPQETDHAAEKTAMEVKKSQYELYKSLLADGYTPKKAAGFIDGELEIDTIGKPKEIKPVQEGTQEETPQEQPQAESIKKKDNKLERDRSATLEHQKQILKNSVIQIERRLVMAAINRVDKNQFEKESEVLTKKEKKELIAEMALMLAGFYTLIMQSEGNEIMSDRVDALGLVGMFTLDKETKQYIKQISAKVAESHINTVTREVLEVARKAALEGLSQTEIVNRIKQNFSDEISKTRAEVIARTETNRAFTQAQYQADRQFILQNDLEGRAYKQWVTRSANPCAFCQALAAEGPIPFDINFRDLGETVTVGSGENKKTLNISFESLEAGNAHPNCSCIYELIIK